LIKLLLIDGSRWWHGKIFISFSSSSFIWDGKLSLSFCWFWFWFLREMESKWDGKILKELIDKDEMIALCEKLWIYWKIEIWDMIWDWKRRLNNLSSPLIYYLIHHFISSWISSTISSHLMMVNKSTNKFTFSKMIFLSSYLFLILERWYEMKIK